jgi:hypothetical protein
MNIAEPTTLEIGCTVWYKGKEYTVIMSNPQGLYMIKRYNDVRWVRPRNVMVKSAHIAQ